MTTHVRRTIGILVAVLASAVTIANGGTAAAAPVELGTASSFSVLAGSTVTNTGPSVLSDDLGLHPGTRGVDVLLIEGARLGRSCDGDEPGST